MNWRLAPHGDPVPLNECPPGPFEFNGSLGFRSEYATTLEEPRRYQVDAYCFETGEYFWGGAKGAEARGKLIVQPLALIPVAAIPATGEGVKDGPAMVTVPREPTKAMLEAACLVDIEIYPTNIPAGLTAPNSAEARAIWVEMLAAAPTIPATGEANHG